MFQFLQCYECQIFKVLLSVSMNYLFQTSNSSLLALVFRPHLEKYCFKIHTEKHLLTPIKTKKIKSTEKKSYHRTEMEIIKLTTENIFLMEKALG